MWVGEGGWGNQATSVGSCGGTSGNARADGGCGDGCEVIKLNSL